MSTKVLLLLALAACAASSLRLEGGSSRCLCQRVHDSIGVNRKLIQRLEIIPPSNYCENVEIIINMTNGNQRCLNPTSEKIKQLLNKLRQRRARRETQ
ncbi:C-X-C motif chemokine 10-like [Megalops cyprinoides]|uniref:C-X-C motif chemokine 10-like n=1 Tax=Megalops cyprinoides TaxID=118141 RepID=UPI0018642F2C|nr:C-X-C motif chemokine 10-like [Megalops cyprinoides]